MTLICLLICLTLGVDTTNDEEVEAAISYTESQLPPLAKGFTRLIHGGPVERIDRYLVDFAIEDLSRRTDFGTAFYTTTSLRYAVEWMFLYVRKSQLDGGLWIVDVSNDALADAITFEPNEREWRALQRYGWGESTLAEFNEEMNNACQSPLEQYERAHIVRGAISKTENKVFRQTSHEQLAFLFPRGTLFFRTRVLGDPKTKSVVLRRDEWRANKQANS